MESLEKSVLITGVSKGLGIELCTKFLDNNWKVFGISRTKTEEILKLQNSYNDKFIWKNYDLADTNNIKQIFNELVKKEAIHAYINNAAIAYDDLITNVQLDPLIKMYKINVFSPIMLTKFVLRNMLLHNVMGSIVHISSISVHTGYKGLAMYASTKGALEAFSKNTAREWGERKIRSNCIVAGFMETEMSSSLTQEQKNRIYQRTSLKVPTEKKSVASMAYFLCTQEASSITGQNIFVDSGTI